MFVRPVPRCEGPCAIRRRPNQLASFRKIVCLAGSQHHCPFRNLPLRFPFAALVIVRALSPPYSGDVHYWSHTDEFCPALPSTELPNNRACRFSIETLFLRPGLSLLLVLRFPSPT